jgi:hypothetical protein
MIRGERIARLGARRAAADYKPTASAAEPAKEGHLEEIKRAVLVKLALDSGNDTSVATE